MEVETNGNLKFGMTEHAPQEDVWPSADGMSSDATVVCIDSDGEEEEAESQAEEFDPDLESRLKEKGLATEAAAKYGSRVNNAALYSQLREPRRGDSDLFRVAHAGKRVSWGREQELAEAEALALATALRTLDANPSPYQTHEERWKQDPARCQRRKKGGSNNNGATDARKGALPSGWAHERADGERPEADSQPPQAPQQQSQAQGQRGNKRRGRRGGRGRKHADREAAGEVPKLEKNLEDELAEQMANQASNESALAQSFSSLRLHVAGGGTMIILNDREITETTPQNSQSHCSAQSTAHSVKEKQEEGNKKPAAAAAATMPAGTSSAKGLGLSKMNTNSAMARSGLLASLQSLRNSRRGCGAFFPPQLLAQVQQGDKAPQPRRVSCNTDAGTSNNAGKKLSAKAQPYVPVACPPAGAQHNRSASQYTTPGLSAMNRRTSTNTGLSQAGASGTGCFMPIYLQDHEEKTTPCHKIMKASLAESLSSLSEVDFSLQRSRLKLQAPPSKASIQHGLEESATECVNKETVLESGEVVSEARANCLREKSVSMGGCNFVMSRKHRRNPTTPAEELLSIIDKGEEFTTFTSPLHLEETLEGLEAEQAALEETQEKMIDLEMENTDLKKTIDTITASTMDVDKLKCANTTLQLLLFLALAKSESVKTGAEIPRGMFGNAGQLGVQELEAVKEKLSSKNSELMQIQKDLEKNSSELQNLSETWLNGLSIKKDAHEGPQTSQKAIDKQTSDLRSSSLKTTSSKYPVSKRSASTKTSSSKTVDKSRTGATVIRRASTKNFRSEIASEKDKDMLSKCHSEKAKKNILPTPIVAPKKTAAKPLWR